jgi:hypothetical protein
VTGEEESSTVGEKEVSRVRLPIMRSGEDEGEGQDVKASVLPSLCCPAVPFIIISCRSGWAVPRREVDDGRVLFRYSTRCPLG